MTVAPSRHPVCPQPVDSTDSLRLWHPRFAPCALCLRPARGFGFFDPEASRPRDYRWFCSLPCQRTFTTRFRKGESMSGTPQEGLALAHVMKRLGLLMDVIGWQQRLCDLSQKEVGLLITEVLESYGAEMSRIAKAEGVPF